MAYNELPFEDDERKEFFYSSLSAIYEDFTPEQVAARLPAFGTSAYQAERHTRGLNAKFLVSH